MPRAAGRRLRGVTMLLALLLAPAAVGVATARADEGMWLVNAISKSLEKKMKEKGMRIDAKVIYDEDSISLADAVVSLDFGCTGSLISNEGLVITNHHCAFSDLHALSTPEHNLLEDGFWAMEAKEEIPIKGKGAFILHKIIDVTDDYRAVVDSLKSLHQVAGSRRSTFMLEKIYQNKYPGYEVSASPFWGGEKWYLAVYRHYTDVRLVGAPPVSAASFGGDIDNWEWPQQKADFALYRIYTAPDGSPADYSDDNVPLVPMTSLVISTQGVHYGDFTMVLGYPGRTSRYSSSYEVCRATNFTNPIQASLQKEQMRIISDAMNRDPLVRLKYSEYYFDLSNVQELREDEAACCRRFGVSNAKCKEERALLADRGGLLDTLKALYCSTDSIERQIDYYRETIVRGVRLTSLANRVANCYDRRDDAGTEVVVADRLKNLNLVTSAKAQFDLPLERELFRFALKTFIANVDSSFWGDFLRSEYARFHTADAMADDVWSRSVFTDWDRFSTAVNASHSAEYYASDPFVATLRSPGMGKFNEARSEEEDGTSMFACQKNYTRAVYRHRIARGEDVYPDANSTLRITYGNVTTLKPKDGVLCHDHTTAKGILEKYDSTKYEYALKPEFLMLLRSGKWAPYGDIDGTMHINFLTNNDITGGNSGSPVLDANGRLVGLAFDGNRESQASNFYYTPEYTDCVCVDIRYVLWVLDRYAHMHRILNELTFE
jgi:hypothetical protein